MFQNIVKAEIYFIINNRAHLLFIFILFYFIFYFLYTFYREYRFRNIVNQK